jgi:amino acid permease
VIGASINIANTVIGGGVLELPFVMRYYGIVLTIILFFMTFFMTLCSILFLLKSQEYSGQNDYKSLARTAFQKKGGVITDVSIFIFDFGVCISFLLIFEDSFERLLIEGFQISEFNFFCKK